MNRDYAGIKTALSLDAPIVEIISCPDLSWLALFGANDETFACFVLSPENDLIEDLHIFADAPLDEELVKIVVSAWCDREFPGHSALTFKREWFGP